MQRNNLTHLLHACMTSSMIIATLRQLHDNLGLPSDHFGLGAPDHQKGRNFII